MAVIPKVRRATNFASNGVGQFAPANSGLVSGLSQVGNVVGQVANVAINKQEARVSQQFELDMMQASTTFEGAMNSIQMPPGGVGYDAISEAAYNEAFGGLTANLPDHLKEAADGRIAELGINIAGQATQRAEQEAESLSRFNLQQGIERIEGEAERNPTAAQSLISNARSLIQNNPDLSPAERREALDQVTENLTLRAETSRIQNDPLVRAAYSGSMEGGPWSTPEQYPYLELARQTSRAETGTNDLYAGSRGIATDTNGSRSYGIFGINSMGTMQSFVAANGDLGLTARPGTADFDAQWRRAVDANPELLLSRQLRWHENAVIAPASASISAAGLPQMSRDPRALSFVGDMIVQYGPRGVQKHLDAAAGASSVEGFISAASTSMRNGLDGDFRTYLSQNPSNRDGLINRINRRESDSLSLTGMNQNLNAGSIGSLRQEATRIGRETVSQRNAQNELASAQMGVQVSRGEVTQETLDEALGNGTLSPSRWESLTEQRDRVEASAQSDTDLLSEFVTRMENTGEGANPFSAEDRRAVDALDDQIVGNSEDPEGARMAMVAQTGVAPRGMVDELRQDIATGGAGAAEALERAAQVIQVAPTAFQVPGGSSINGAVADFQAATRAGYDSARAAEIANPTSEQRATNEGTRTEINAEVRDISADDVMAEFDSYLPFDALDASPLVRSEILRDYETVYRAERQRGLGADVAQAAAIAQLTDPVNGMYGRSEFAAGGEEQRDPFLGISNGADLTPQVMRHPPERYFPPVNGGHDYIGEDIRTSLEGLGADFGQGWTLSTDEGETDSYVRSIRNGQFQGYPAYTITYFDDAGVPQQALWTMEQEVIDGMIESNRPAFEAERAAIAQRRQIAQDQAAQPLAESLATMPGVNPDTVPRSVWGN